MGKNKISIMTVNKYSSLKFAPDKIRASLITYAFMWNTPTASLIGEGRRYWVDGCT
jgi:hypothetical protein